MKKSFRILFALGALLAALLAFGACAEKHAEHDFGEWETVTEATCETDGLQKRTCKECGESETQPLPSLGHLWGDAVANGNGKHVEVCTRDPSHRRETDCSLEVTVVEPTCTSGGYTSHTCSACGYTYADAETQPVPHKWSAWMPSDEIENAHYRVCEYDTEHTHIETGSCSFTAGTAVAATCDTDGYTPYTCDECHKSVHRDPVSALTHAWGPWVSDGDGHHTRTCGNDDTHTETKACEYETETTEPTCLSGGYTTYTCPDCHDEYESERTAPAEHTWGSWTPTAPDAHTHKRVCSECSTEDTADCSFNIETTDPTCEEDGVVTHTCPLCEGTHTHPGEPALGHALGGYEKIAEKPGYHKQKCTRCDYFVESACVLVDHTIDPTCTAAGRIVSRCVDCDYETEHEGAPMIDHKWTKWEYAGSEGNDFHTRSCEVCTASEQKKCSFKSIQDLPTCTEPAAIRDVCEDCEHAKDGGTVEALGHAYGDWTHVEENGQRYHVRTCTRQGCLHPEFKEACSYKIETTDPSCENDGVKKMTCLVCEEVLTEKYGDKLEHHFVSPVYDDAKHSHTEACSLCGEEKVTQCDFTENTVDPTCTEAGYTDYSCPVCGGSYREAGAAKLDHDWGSWAPNGNNEHMRICQNNNAHVETKPCDYDDGQVTQPTCTAGGYTTYTCRDCHGTRIDHRTPENGHTYTDGWEYAGTDRVEHGEHRRKCSVCEEYVYQNCVFDETRTPATCDAAEIVTHTCTLCNTAHTHEGEAAHGHNWGPLVFDAATGTHHKTCLNDSTHVERNECSFSVTEERDPSCLVMGSKKHICSECGGSYIEYTVRGDHSWTEWTNPTDATHFRTCSTCGTKTSGACKFTDTTVDPTCTTAGYTLRRCTVCMHEFRINEKAALGHTFGSYRYTGTEDHGTHERSCLRENCGEVVTGECVVVEVGQAATCTTPGNVKYVCKFCGHTDDKGYVGSLGHKYREQATHSFENGVHSHTFECERCGKTTSGNCDFEVTTTNATCVVPGTFVYRCSLCNYSYTEVKTDDVLGHIWQYTEQTDGTHTAVCERDPTHREVVPHDYSLSNVCPCGHDGLTYELRENGTVCVSNDNKVSKAERIVIAPFYEGHPVTEIARYAFLYNSAVREVVLPATLITIGEYAFEGCGNLSHVSIDLQEEEPALVSIGDYAFCRCTSLLDAHLPETLLSIGKYAFMGCTALDDIHIPDSVTTIGTHAFSETAYIDNPAHWTGDALYVDEHLLAVHTSVQTFTIRGGTLSVGAEAFEGCTALTEIVIPEETAFFDIDAFKGCTALRSVVYHGTLQGWLTIVFMNDLASPMHYAAGLNLSETTGAIVIPHGVTSIPAGTFRGTAITSVSIPDTVTSIGAYAFANCTSLTTIEMADSVLKIGEKAFDGCGYALDEDNWDGGVALYICKHLISVRNDRLPENGKFEIRNTTLSIAPYAFEGCTKLVELVLPDELRFIGQDAFKDCVNFVRANFRCGNANYAYSFYAQGIIGRSMRPASLSETVLAGSLRSYNRRWERV